MNGHRNSDPRRLVIGVVCLLGAAVVAAEMVSRWHGVVITDITFTSKTGAPLKTFKPGDELQVSMAIKCSPSTTPSTETASVWFARADGFQLGQTEERQVPVAPRSESKLRFERRFVVPSSGVDLLVRARVGHRTDPIELGTFEGSATAFLYKRGSDGVYRRALEPLPPNVLRQVNGSRS